MLLILKTCPYCGLEEFYELRTKGLKGAKRMWCPVCKVEFVLSYHIKQIDYECLTIQNYKKRDSLD